MDVQVRVNVLGRATVHSTWQKELRLLHANGERVANDSRTFLIDNAENVGSIENQERHTSSGKTVKYPPYRCCQLHSITFMTQS